MVNLRSRSKTGMAAPRTALKMESTVSAPSMISENEVDLSEAALRNLPRAKLQKLAMAYKIKANMKSVLIIRELSKVQRKRPAEDDRREGPSRKRQKTEAPSEQAPASWIPKNPVTSNGFYDNGETGVRSNAAPAPSVNDLQHPEAGPSSSRQTSQEQEAPTALSYDEVLFSGSESMMTEEDQLDFTTPVSSRAGTPQLAHPHDLRRCVQIMREISGKDQAMLKEVIAMNETTIRLHARAKEVRDLAKAERARRERMEAYFHYWQDTHPRWDRRWMYGEKLMSNREMRLQGLDAPVGPPTVSAHRGDQEAQQSDELSHRAVPVRKQGPILSLEELREMRQAIVSKQEADRRRLEAQQRREELDESSSSEESSAPIGVAVRA